MSGSMFTDLASRASAGGGGGLQLPSPSDPMQQINPYYTRQQMDNSLAPLAGFQQFRQTGQLPAQFAGWMPYTPPPAQTFSIAPQVIPAPSYAPYSFSNVSADRGEPGSGGN